MITATYDGIPVEVEDAFRSGAVLLVCIRTLDGSQPFVGGDKWPVRTDRKTVIAVKLQDVQNASDPVTDIS